MRTFIADFETTTNESDCHVWAFALVEVGNPKNLMIGTSIDDFMDLCQSEPDNIKVLFHNLKFDIHFIFSWLFKNGFKHVHDRKERASNTFTTLITSKGMYYSLEIIFYMRGKNIKKLTIQDSYKLIPLSVEEIAKSFRLPFSKGKIDYDARNDMPIGTPLSKDEIDYISKDVLIVEHAISFFYSQGLTGMTIGSCALNEYKSLVGMRNFKRWFPDASNYHEDVHPSYRGGFTYLNPKFAGKLLGKGIVLDVNGLYSAVMKESYLPYGTPIFYKGEYKEDKSYPLYIQMIRCVFELKHGKIPTIQVKHSLSFRGNEYLTSSDDEELVLCLNSVDLELFLEQYEVHNIEYLSGWKFRSARGFFDTYIDKWNGLKQSSILEENWGMYLIAKYYLNSLYGKFGTNIWVKSKLPYFDPETQKVSFKDSELEPKQGLYIAMASFITSYARLKTISSAQKIMDDYNSGKSNIQFVYADTDSLHLLTDDFEIPEGLEIDQVKLGAWKIEGKFRRAKYLRQKCYMDDFTKDIHSENPEYKYKITVAGMPKECYEFVDFNNFKIGASYKGKKTPEIVPGGVILRSIDFTIKK